MKIKNFIFIWHAFAFSYLFFFLLLFSTFPEIETFSYLTKYHGYVDIEDWDSYYLIILSIIALIINNIFIIAILTISGKLKRNKTNAIRGNSSSE